MKKVILTLLAATQFLPAWQLLLMRKLIFASIWASPITILK